jgi:hypothetical protein
MKNKQDILKLHPMIGRLTPMQWDEIHKAMDAYLNEYKAEQLTLTDVSKCNCDGNDDVFEEQYVLQHLINNTWQVVGEKTNTVWKQGEKEDCIKWMDL